METPRSDRARSLIRMTIPRSSSAMIPSSSDSSTAVMSWSSCFERVEARRELLGHPVQRRGQIAHLARRGERGPAMQVARRDRARDVPQLDDGLRDAPREQDASASAPSSAISPLTSTSRCAPRTISSSRRC
jgi:hypothetical protein